MGFTPTTLLNAAGTRPEPAVSVPSEKLTSPLRDRDARTGARAARNVTLVERRGARAVRRARADQAGRELVEVRLADRNRAGVDQPRHRRRARSGHVREGRTARRGRDAGEVDVVLDRERDAEERQPFTLGAPAPRAAATNAAARSFGKSSMKIGRAPTRVDAPIRLGEHVGGRYLAAGETRSELVRFRSSWFGPPPQRRRAPGRA